MIAYLEGERAGGQPPLGPAAPARPSRASERGAALRGPRHEAACGARLSQKQPSHVCTHVHVCACETCVHICACTFTHAQTFTHTCVNTEARTCAHARTRTHIFI